MINKILEFNNLSSSQINQIFNPLVIEDVLNFKALNKVGTRIKEALVANEKIVVVGDYDTDGICATTILVDTFFKLNKEVGYYIPNRIEEGYGLSVDLVSLIKEKGYDLIITVDNGVNSFEAITLAKSLNIDVIVTDHHELSGFDFPYLLHPSLLPKRYQSLAGAGIALILSRYLLDFKIIPYHFVLAMIASIGDMVEVFDENRVIIQAGLKYLNQNNYYPIDKLLNKSKLVSETDIGFNVVPKLNTIGRLADEANAYHLVNYLLSEDKKEIDNIAKQIERLNNKRKDLTKAALLLSNKIERWGDFQVLYDESIHEGIAGIVAGRLVNESNLPTLVFTKSEKGLRASGRSFKGFDLFQFLSQFTFLFESFGGHQQACGLSISESNYLILKKKITELGPLSFQEEIKEYLTINFSNINYELLKEIDSLRPFGMGFKEPEFLIDNFNYQSFQILKNEHLKFITYSKDIEALYFFGKDELNKVSSENNFKVVGSLSINKFNGKETINIIIRELIL